MVKRIPSLDRLPSIHYQLLLPMSHLLSTFRPVHSADCGLVTAQTAHHPNQTIGHKLAIRMRPSLPPQRRPDKRILAAGICIYKLRRISRSSTTDSRALKVDNRILQVASRILQTASRSSQPCNRKWRPSVKSSPRSKKPNLRSLGPRNQRLDTASSALVVLIWRIERCYKEWVSVVV
jgi:hypothetical protein